MYSVNPPAVAPDATGHAAVEPLTPTAIIPAVTREKAPHLPAAISMLATAPPPYDEPVAHPQGIDVASPTMLKMWLH